MKRLLAHIFLKYLQTLTRSYVKRHEVEIIGLTGSVGKTTLTLAVYEILKTKYKVGMTYKDGKGLNSETGLPFAFLGVDVRGYSSSDWIRYLLQATYNFFFKKFKYEKMIVEMGVDKPGDMDFLLSMVDPQIGVFLSLASVHGANFYQLQKERKGVSQKELIFEEKAKLIKSISKSGTTVLNFDSRKIMSLADKVDSDTLTFGLREGADVRGRILDVSSEFFTAEVNYKWKKRKIRVEKYLINKKIFTTLLAAVAVGVTSGVNLEKCLEALSTLEFPPGRMTKFQGIKNTTIIDSSYNASKPAVFEALDNLSLFVDKKKVGILGDMRELGDQTKSEHEQVAKKAVKIADELVVIGPSMRDYFVPKVLELGYDKKSLHLFSNPWSALTFIKKKLLKGGEAILVKGSQNTLFLELIVEGLLKYKSKRKELCRRGKFWEKERERLRS